MKLTQEIKKGALLVTQNAQHVIVNEHKIVSYSKSICTNEKIILDLDEEAHFTNGTDEEKAGYIICLDSINFGSGYFHDLKKRPGLSGYRTIAQCLKDHFINNGILSPLDLSNITANDCFEIFEQDNNNKEVSGLIKLFSEALKQTGEHIVDNYENSYTQFVLQAKNSADRLIKQLLEISYFNDHVEYKGKTIPVLKRAQITVADLNLIFKGQGLGYFHDYDQLTAFADNVIPHVLYLDGILDYSPELIETIKKEKEIAPNSIEETELRLCAIYAIERIKEEAIKADHTITAVNIDHILWERGHEPYYLKSPRHRTRTARY